MMNSFIAEMSDKKRNHLTFVIEYLFILFYLPHNDYKKYKPKKKQKKKKKWRGDLAETVGAYQRLVLLEVRAKAV